MEQLWSRAGATGGNRRQNQTPPELREHAKSVATDCQRLRKEFHGKEGVNGSSPLEGLEKSLQFLLFLAQTRPLLSLGMRGWSRLWSSQVWERLILSPAVTTAVICSAAAATGLTTNPDRDEHLRTCRFLAGATAPTPAEDASTADLSSSA